MGLINSISKLYDDLVAIRNPKKAIQNKHFRNVRENFSYRQARRNRISGIKLGIGGNADDHAPERDLWTLREYARELDRDNIIASSILDRATESIIGCGLDIQIHSGNKRWDEAAEQLFKDWWENESDVRGMLSGWQMEQLAYRALKVDGDILFIKLDSGQLQAVEGDRVSTPADRKSDPNIINGVEVNSFGKPIAYWISEADSKLNRVFDSKKYKRINAEQCIFLMNTKRFSQTRGITVFATNMQLFEDIDAFIEACLVGAKVSISHVMFIQREGDVDALDGISTGLDEAGNERTEQFVDPGMIMYGKPNEKATMLGSTQPMVQFSPFVTQLLRFTGLNFGLPLEMLSLDFSRTNYSSARAALLVAHKAFLSQHRFMVTRFMEPIIRWKVDHFMASGRLPDRPNGYQVSATPPRFLSVDPLKETQADVSRVQHGFTTNREICASLGYDWNHVFAQRAREIEEAIKLSQKIADKSEQKIDWRDVIGDAKNFDEAIYRDDSQIAINPDQRE